MNKPTVEVLLLSFKKQFLGCSKEISEIKKMDPNILLLENEVVTKALKTCWENVKNFETGEEFDFLMILNETCNEITNSVYGINIENKTTNLKKLDTKTLAQVQVLKILADFIKTGIIDNSELEKFLKIL